MTRYAVRMAVGLGVLLVPVLAHAQTAPRIVRPWGGPFSNLTFGATTAASNPRPRLPMFTSQLPLGPQPKPSVVPDLPVKPPPCVMPVVPSDPALDARMPIVKVDERVDPRFVAKVPPCEPKRK